MKIQPLVQPYTTSQYELDMKQLDAERQQLIDTHPTISNYYRNPPQCDFTNLEDYIAYVKWKIDHMDRVVAFETSAPMKALSLKREILTEMHRQSTLKDIL